MKKRLDLAFLLVALLAQMPLFGQAFPKFSPRHMQVLQQRGIPNTAQVPSFLIRDIRGLPVTGANIELNFLEPISATSELSMAQMALPEKPHYRFSEGSEEGIYTLDSIQAYGWYKVRVRARGYAPVDFNYKFIVGSKVRLDLWMCPANLEPIYWGHNLTYWRPENQAWTILSLKNQYQDPAKIASLLQAELAHLQSQMPFKSVLTPGQIYVQLPAADSSQRQLMKVLNSSSALQAAGFTFEQTTNSGYLMPDATAMVCGNYDSAAVRRHFWDFDCKVISCDVFNGEKQMKLRLQYRGAMSLDYFRRVSGFFNKFNVGFFSPNSIMRVTSGPPMPPRRPEIAPIKEGGIRRPK